MADGVPPDRICALTFSRKAAGEIFDSVVQYLQEAAASDESAARTAKRIARPDLGSSDFLAMLRRLVEHIHRMHIGTLDSFIVGIVRAFPAELGIPQSFQVMDAESVAAKDVQERALAQIFDPQRAGPQKQRAFFEAFKQATFGREEKGLGALLDSFVTGCRDSYQVLPQQDAWGKQDVIWPDGGPWLVPVDKIGAVIEQLKESLNRSGLSERPMERWMKFLSAASEFHAGAAWSGEIEYMFSKLMPLLGDLAEGHATLRLDRIECPMTTQQCRNTLQVLHHIMHEHIRASVQQTRGIFRVLNEFERVYDDAVRRTGKLTFTDAQYLLTPANNYSGGAVLSRIPGQADRVYIDYRLDCRLDHWLLDEFQDTSDLQWTVLRNLIDEVVQDDTGQRSFFYVGDMKQAIYGWRGGNARLFRAVLEEYHPSITQVPLATSHRSSQPVIDVVNQVFSDLSATDLPPRAVENWAEIWQTHETVVKNEGYVALIEPPFDGENKPTAQDRDRMVARLLDHIRPLDRGLSVAVLVRDNKSGRRLVDCLRRECPSLTIVHEGNATITDSPVVAVLLSLVKHAAHPGDLFALRHLQMSPLSKPLEAAGAIAADLPAYLLSQIHHSGFRDFIAHWGDELHNASPADPFGRLRLNDLLDAAGEFDASGSRDCDAFLRSAESFEIHEVASGQAIRVMTVHQSKGLGFDVVILPDLMTRGITKAKNPGLVVSHVPDSTVPRWVLQLPRRLVSEYDPVLNREIDTVDAEACFDELCVLYVAMTRAKRALYLVTSYPGKTSTSITAGALVKKRLIGETKPDTGEEIILAGTKAVRLFEAGEADWFERVDLEPEEPARPLSDLPGDFADRESTRTRLSRVEPSAEERTETRASTLFNPEMSDVLDFGSAIHELFEQVEWIEEADVETIVEPWKARTSVSDEVARDVIKQFEAALTEPELRGALARPEGKAYLWRERRFEVVLNRQEWVSGVFDRVVILPGKNGEPERATILDYKSDRISEEDQFARAVERYRPQLDLYSHALSRILSLPRERITLQLLFTRTGRVFDV